MAVYTIYICKSAFCKLHFSFLDFFLYSMFGDFNFPSFYVFHIEFFNFQPWVVIQKLSLSLCIFLSIFYIFQIEFFNYQPWVVIQKLSLPLCIFFRCFILPVNSCGFSRVCFTWNIYIYCPGSWVLLPWRKSGKTPTKPNSLIEDCYLCQTSPCVHVKN